MGRDIHTVYSWKEQQSSIESKKETKATKEIEKSVSLELPWKFMVFAGIAEQTCEDNCGQKNPLLGLGRT